MPWYLTGDLEDCETRNSEIIIQWIQRGTWGSIRPKGHEPERGPCTPLFRLAGLGDHGMTSKTHCPTGPARGLQPGTEPYTVGTLKRNRVNCTIKKPENPIDSLRGYFTQRLLRPAPCVSLLLAMQPKRKRKKDMLKNSRLLPLPCPKECPTIPLPSILDVLPAPFSLPWPLNAAAGYSSHTAPPQTPAPKTPG